MHLQLVEGCLEEKINVYETSDTHVAAYVAHLHKQRVVGYRRSLAILPIYTVLL